MGSLVESQAIALLERAEECGVIAVALEAAREGAGSLTVIEGPAGIGKTQLLLVARRKAAEAGMVVAGARGSELERERAFGVVRQLLEPVVGVIAGPARAELLSGSAALAAPIFEPDLVVHRGDAESRDQAFAVMHGLYWLCANLCQRRPLLLAVDDAHWADLASLRFLAYLAQRRDGLGLALVVAARAGETPEVEDVLVRLASDPQGLTLSPSPLSRQAVGRLLSDEFGRQAEQPFVDACRSATGGVPFLVGELLRELRRRRVEPVAAMVGEVGELGPRTVARVVVARVRRLMPEALRLARAAAVLGDDADRRLVARLAGVGDEVASMAFDALETAGVLCPAWSVEFVHPIVRSALYADIAVGERSRFHADAARLLAEVGASEERMASQLLATGPGGGQATVEVLHRTARSALLHGAAGSAVSYLERALAEPPAGQLRVEVLRDLGRGYAMAGNHERFGDVFGQAIMAAGSAVDRGEIGLDFGRALASAGDFAAAASVFLAALDGLEGPNSQLVVALESELFTIGRGDTIRSRFRRRLAELDAGELDHPSLLAPLALWLVNTQPPAARGADVAERAARDSRVELNSVVQGGVGNALLFAGRLQRAEQVYGRTIAAAHRTGSRLTLGWTSAFRARVRLELGEIAGAVSDAEVGFELLGDPGERGLVSGRSWALANLLEGLLAAGQTGEAERLVDEFSGAFAGSPSYARALVLGARGRLRLAQGRAEDALSDALASRELAPPNPAARPWRSDAALALRALGRVDEGRELAEEELDAARQFEVPHAIGFALRAVAACSAEPAAMAAWQEAVDVLERSEARLELARALVELGAGLRRSGHRRDCEGPLRRGLDIAHRCGIAPLAERARAELRAAGARPRREALSGVEALTPSERRVAELAAGGMTNRQIAQELFVTARTVEGHLTHVFGKLGITSRHGLHDRLTAEAVD
jgi:DNA-binding CsgD family transcriptional regulator